MVRRALSLCFDSTRVWLQHAVGRLFMLHLSIFTYGMFNNQLANCMILGFCCRCFSRQVANESDQKEECDWLWREAVVNVVHGKCIHVRNVIRCSPWNIQMHPADFPSGWKSNESSSHETRQGLLLTQKTWWSLKEKWHLTDHLPTTTSIYLMPPMT